MCLLDALVFLKEIPILGYSNLLSSQLLADTELPEKSMKDSQVSSGQRSLSALPGFPPDFLCPTSEIPKCTAWTLLSFLHTSHFVKSLILPRPAFKITSHHLDDNDISLLLWAKLPTCPGSCILPTPSSASAAYLFLLISVPILWCAHVDWSTSTQKPLTSTLTKIFTSTL